MTKLINTACAHCTFRINNEKGEQVSCELGRLEKFLEKNQAHKEKDFYIIERFCNTCSAEQISKETILKQREISYCLIVYGWNDYWQTLKSIPKLNIKPKEVYVILDDTKLLNKKKYDEYSEIFKNTEIPLTFKTYFDGSDHLKMIDEIIQKTKTQYYSYIKRPIPRDFVDKYNQMINYDMDLFNAHIKKTYLNSFIACYLHRLVYGNSGKIVTDKIKELLDMQEDIKHKDSVIIDE